MMTPTERCVSQLTTTFTAATIPVELFEKICDKIEGHEADKWPLYDGLFPTLETYCDKGWKSHRRRLKVDFSRMSLVCKRWNDVLRQNPDRFVLTIAWDEAACDCEQGEKLVKKYRAWLSNSKLCDIDFLFVKQDFIESRDSVTKHLQDMFSILRSYSHQWRAFLICRGNEPLIAQLSTSLVKLVAPINGETEACIDAPRLDLFTFVGPQFKEPLPFSLRAPKLSTLTLFGIELDLVRNPDFQGIQSLSISCKAFELPALQLLQELRELSLQFFNPNDPIPDPLDISLPHLTKLVLQGYEEEVITCLQLYCPMLKECDLLIWDYNGNYVGSSLWPRHALATPPLDRIFIRAISTTAFAIDTLTHLNVNNVTELYISYSTYNPWMLCDWAPLATVSFPVLVYLHVDSVPSIHHTEICLLSRFNCPKLWSLQVDYKDRPATAGVTYMRYNPYAAFGLTYMPNPNNPSSLLDMPSLNHLQINAHNYGDGDNVFAGLIAPQLTELSIGYPKCTTDTAAESCFVGLIQYAKSNPTILSQLHSLELLIEEPRMLQMQEQNPFSLTPSLTSLYLGIDSNSENPTSYLQLLWSRSEDILPHLENIYILIFPGSRESFAELDTMLQERKDRGLPNLKRLDVFSMQSELTAEDFDRSAAIANISTKAANFNFKDANSDEQVI